MKILLGFIKRFRSYYGLKFFKNFLEFLKKKNTVTLKMLKIAEKSNGSIIANTQSFVEVIQFKEICHGVLHQPFKGLEQMLC